jgi:hypothetical protein
VAEAVPSIAYGEVDLERHHHVRAHRHLSAPGPRRKASEFGSSGPHPSSIEGLGVAAEEGLVRSFIRVAQVMYQRE